MFSQNSNLAQFNKKNIFIWFLLAFQAGCINAGGFLSCHRFVSHITGFATFFGAEMAQENYQSAIGMLLVPLFFLIGSMTSGFLIDRQLAKGQMPLYPLSFGFITFGMLSVTLLGMYGYFGIFGSAWNSKSSLLSDFILLAILCLSAGIQNATITSASGSVVRTTHLTGITTDLGIGLIRVFATGQSSWVQSHEAKANIMRFGIITFFVLGSLAAAFVFLHWQYLGFLLPTVISFGLLTYTTRVYVVTKGWLK